MKVRKNANGKYRVYGVYSDRTRSEVRYSKRVDAQDYIIRRGGYLIYEDFENAEDAQNYLEKKKGQIWW